MRHCLREDNSRPAWFVVSKTATAAERVGEVATAAGYATRHLATINDLTDDRDFREATNPVVLIADADGDAALAAAVAAFAERDNQHGIHVYVADTIAGETYKRLLHTGTSDWLTWGNLATELGSLVEAKPAQRRARTARVWSFLPSKGGSGNTMLAIEAGYGLSEKRSRRSLKVAIVDLDVGGGTLADALDVEARFDVGEILDRPERLDGQLVDIFTSRHSPRLDLFATPKRWVDPARVDPQLLFNFLDLVATRYDDILLDIPRGWYPWLDDLLRGSDGVIVTGEGTVPALRQMKRQAARLTELGVPHDKVALVVTRCEIDLLGRVVRKTELERAFPSDRLFFVRHDLATVVSALNTGQAIGSMAPTTRIGRDIQGVIDWLDSLSQKLALPAGAQAEQGFSLP